MEAVERMYETGILITSADSEKAVMQLRIDNDTVQAFLMEDCILDKTGRIERTELYKKYEQYCEETDRQSLTKNNFYKSLRVKGYPEITINGYRYFKCISDKKTVLNRHLKTALDGFVSMPEGYQETLPFD